MLVKVSAALAFAGGAATRFAGLFHLLRSKQRSLDACQSGAPSPQRSIELSERRTRGVHPDQLLASALSEVIHEGRRALRA
jgi:hypothetical protein